MKQKMSSCFGKTSAAFLAADNIYNAHIQAQGIQVVCSLYYDASFPFKIVFTQWGKLYK